jgi:monoamine oxidase
MAGHRGLANPESRVLIIGAGIAGLTAAKELAKQRFQITVLEARNRVGGRIHTDRSLDAPVERGASFFHGGPKNPLKIEAKQFDIVDMDYGAGELYDITANGTNSYRVRDLATLLPMDFQHMAIYRFLLAYAKAGLGPYRREWFLNWLGRPASTISLGDVCDKISRDLERNPSKPSLASRFSRTFRALKETGFASPVGELSYRNLVLKSETKEKGLILPKGEKIVTNGMCNLANMLKQKLDIRLNHVVQEISYRCGHVQVTATNSETDSTEKYEAEAVVVTVPVGVLLKKRIRFDPPLQRAYKQAMAMIDMGLLNKVAIKFEAPFWPIHVPLFVGTPQSTTQYTWFLNLCYTGQPILLGFVGGLAAQELEQQTDDIAAQRMLNDLQKIFGPKVKPTVGKPIVTRWGADEFAYGSYSRFRLGALGHERRLLTQPLVGTLFFAGEATHPNDPSTLHGAYWSGQRVARQIAGL